MIKNIITCFLLAGSIPLSAQTIHGNLSMKRSAFTLCQYRIVIASGFIVRNGYDE